jgi:hypothetical protein
VPSGPIGHCALVEASQDISEKTSEATHDVFQVGGTDALDEAAAALDEVVDVLEVVAEFREHSASFPDTASSPAKSSEAGQVGSQPLGRPTCRPRYSS